MENASKAVVIAGSILVAVMLVSLGVLIYNIASKTASDIGLKIEDIAKNAENKMYLSYVGNDKSASSVQALLSVISANNSNQNSSYTIEVKLVGGGKFSPSKESVSTASDIMSVYNEITSKDTVYNVGVTALDNSGIISTIQITGKDR